MDWPADGEVSLETSLHHRLTGPYRADEVVALDDVDLLGAEVDIDWTVHADSNGLQISLPESPPASLDYVYVLRLCPRSRCSSTEPVFLVRISLSSEEAQY